VCLGALDFKSQDDVWSFCDRYFSIAMSKCVQDEGLDMRTAFDAAGRGRVALRLLRAKVKCS